MSRVRTNLLTRPIWLIMDAYRWRGRSGTPVRPPVPMRPGGAVPYRHPVPTRPRILPVQPHALPISVRDETVIVSGAIWRFPAREGEDAVVAEKQQEEPLEFFPEDDIDDEVDAGIDRDEQVAGVDQLVKDRRVGNDVEGLHAVEHHGSEVADEEYYNHAEEHGGQANFSTLDARQALTFAVCFTHLLKQ